MCYAAIVCFGLCPCQHNGIYTWNVYPATPTKKPAQILRFAESKNEPLSRKILGKAAQKALGKGTGPSNLPKSILASFCHASKNGCKKAQKASISLYRDTNCHPLRGSGFLRSLFLFSPSYAGNGMTSLSGGSSFGCFSSGCMALSTVPMSR